MILGLGQKIYKISLEHIIAMESKKAPKGGDTHTHTMEASQRDIEAYDRTLADQS